MKLYIIFENRIGLLLQNNIKIFNKPKKVEMTISQ